MHFLEETMVHVDAGIEVRLGFVVAHRTGKELSPALVHPLTSAQGEPLPLRAAAGTVLRCAMRIDFHRDGASREGLLFPKPVDMPSQLVGLFAIEPPGLARCPRLDLAQPFEEQHAAGVLRAHPRNGMSRLAGGVAVHAAYMPPELPIAVLSFDGLAGEPLLCTDALQVPVAVLIQPTVADEHRFDDHIVPPDRDHSQVFDVQVYCHRHEIGVEPAHLDFRGFDLFLLGEVQFRRPGAQNQLRALLFPGRICAPLL